MIQPSTDELTKRYPSRYALAVVAARRARELNDGAKPLVETTPAEKPVSIALREIAAGRVGVGMPKR